MTDDADTTDSERVMTEDGLPLGTVTFLLTDIESSSPRWDLEPVHMAAAIELHDEILGGAIAEHGGVRPREQGEGDSMVAVFTRASDAVRAARDAQRGLAAASWPTEQPLRVRMGLHTGEARHSRSVGYTGTSIIRAARIRSLARAGEILMSDTVRLLAADEFDDEPPVDLGEHELDGLLRPERIWRLSGDETTASHPSRSPHQRRHNVPSWPATFIGRVAEIAALRSSLGTERVVTVVGPGGGGKTRLAHQVAIIEADEHRDGAWWLDLITVGDEALIVPTLSQVLDVPEDLDDPLRGLCARLAHSDRLVVLDNCEHLLDEVARVVAELSTSCPDLTVLATSRAPLGVGGELIWTIPPLDAADGAQLFIERARHVRHNFSADPQALATINAVCDRLDGIPLPIELAAARCKLLTPAQILVGLQDAIGLLTGGARTSLQRHQTIEASIAWSHGLLRPDEQLLLRRLSVFESTFSLDAVEAVCADDQLPPNSLLDLLERLVDQSLVQTTEGREGLRFRLLETVRQFARHALASSGGDAELTRRHTTWFADRGRSCWPLYVPDMVAILDRLEDDRLDILMTLGRVLSEGDPDDVASVSLGVLPTLDVRHPAEAGEWAARVRSVLGDQPSHDYGLLSVRLSEIAINRGDAEGAERAMAMAMGIAEQLGDDEVAGTGRALQVIWTGIAEPHVGVEIIDDTEIECRRSGAVHDADSLIWCAAMMHSMVGHRDEAARRFERAEREVVDECPRCASQRRLGWANFDLDCGLPRSAAARAAAGRMANRDLADHSTECFALAVLARVGIVSDDRDSDTEADLRVAWARALAANDMYSLMFMAAPAALLARADGDLTTARQVLPGTRTMAAVDVVDAVAATMWVCGAGDEASVLVDQTFTELAGIAPGRAKAVLEHRGAVFALLHGDVEQAEVTAHQALEHSRLGPWPVEAIAALELIATLDVHRGWDASAARLVGATAAAREVTGVRMSLDPERTLVRNAVATARERLGGDDFEREVGAGAALTLDEATEYALRTHGERRRPNFGWDALTPTEHQVAALAAQGLTNPKIAERLLMGRETVKTHLSSIYLKTGLANRTQLAVEFPRD